MADEVFKAKAPLVEGASEESQKKAQKYADDAARRAAREKRLAERAQKQNGAPNVDKTKYERGQQALNIDYSQIQPDVLEQWQKTAGGKGKFDKMVKNTGNIYDAADLLTGTVNDDYGFNSIKKKSDGQKVIEKGVIDAKVPSEKYETHTGTSKIIRDFFGKSDKEDVQKVLDSLGLPDTEKHYDMSKADERRQLLQSNPYLVSFLKNEIGNYSDISDEDFIKLFSSDKPTYAFRAGRGGTNKAVSTEAELEEDEKQSAYKNLTDTEIDEDTMDWLENRYQNFLNRQKRIEDSKPETSATMGSNIGRQYPGQEESEAYAAEQKKKEQERTKAYKEQQRISSKDLVDNEISEFLNKNNIKASVNEKPYMKGNEIDKTKGSDYVISGLDESQVGIVKDYLTNLVGMDRVRYNPTKGEVTLTPGYSDNKMAGDSLVKEFTDKYGADKAAKIMEILKGE